MCSLLTKPCRIVKLLLIDGHSLAYRAFYAMPPLSNSKGQTTQAILGVANMVFKILKEEKPTHLVVFFDRGIPAFRLDAYKEYKAGRPETPEDFQSQMPFIKEFFESMGVPVVEESGFEADDWIATTVHQAEPVATEILVLSGDLDLLQLVSEKTRVLVSKKGISNLTRYTPEEVDKRFSLKPSQLIDYKALAGDASDNIKGVAGLGEKGAIKLLTEYQSVDSILKNTEKLSPKIQNAVNASRDRILLNQDLVTLRKDAPFQFDPQKALLPAEPLPSLVEFLDKMEFKGLLSRLGVYSAADYEIPPYTLVDSDEKLRQMAEAFRKSKEAALLLRPPLSPFWKDQQLAVEAAGRWIVNSEFAKRALSELTKDKSEKEIFVYDWKSFHLFCLEEKIETLPWKIHDCLITGWLANSSRTDPSIPELAKSNLDVTLPEKLEKETDLLSSWVSVLIPLGRDLGIKLAAMGLEPIYSAVERPLVDVLAEMECKGVALDSAYLKALSSELRIELERFEKEIYETAGTAFNINSSRQLGQILFEKLKLPTGKKNKTGYSTNVEELERLSEHSPLPKLILQYRELAKLLNTYLDVFPELILDRTGRIHTTYVQTGSATGRLSSKDPNLQNIPIRTEYGKKIRKAFIAQKPDWKILAADYSQIELRLLAHFSKDPVLVESFKNNEDIHARTASEIFKVTPDEVTSDMRRMAKVVNFGLLYGMTEHGLSTGLKISREEAKEFIKRYFERFTSVGAYLENSLAEAKETGSTKTLLGRRRPVPELHSKNSFIRSGAERIAVNAPLQGTAADLIKLAMIRISERLKKEKRQAFMVMQVHDELVLEVPESELEAVADLVKHEMENAFHLEVPLTVDIVAGKNWADAGPFSSVRGNAMTSR